MTTIKEHLENIFPEYGGCGCMSCDSLDIRELIEQAIKMIDKELIGKDDTNSENGYFGDRNNLRNEQRQKLQ